MATDFIAQRKQMSKLIEASQKSTSEAIYKLDDVKRAPVPYFASSPAPALSGPLPADVHLIRSSELRPKKTALFEPNEATGFNLNPRREKPWAYFERPQPSIFDAAKRSTSDAAGVEQMETGPAKSVNADLALACHNEWNLQKNGFNPAIAAQMRINVRKSAQVAEQIQNPPERQYSLYTSQNVKMALGEADVPPAPVRQPITKDRAFPRS